MVHLSISTKTLKLLISKWGTGPTHFPDMHCESNIIAIGNVKIYNISICGNSGWTVYQQKFMHAFKNIFFKDIHNILQIRPSRFESELEI